MISTHKGRGDLSYDEWMLGDELDKLSVHHKVHRYGVERGKYYLYLSGNGQDSGRGGGNYSNVLGLETGA